MANVRGSAKRKGQPQLDIPPSWIGREEAARMLGISLAKLQVRFEELGARLGRVPGKNAKKWFFDPDVIRAKVATGPQQPIKLYLENHEGNRDSRVFAALEQGQSVASIVIAEKVSAAVVLQLRERWIEAHHADRKGLSFLCGCGAPSNPGTARCDKCAARTRVLTDVELAALAGTPPPERETCVCSGCSGVVDTAASDHMCRKCVGRIAVIARGGKVFVLLNGVVLRELADDEVKLLAVGIGPVGQQSASEERERPVKARRDDEPKSESMKLIAKARLEAKREAEERDKQLSEEMRRARGLDAAAGSTLEEAFKMNPAVDLVPKSPVDITPKNPVDLTPRRPIDPQ